MKYAEVMVDVPAASHAYTYAVPWELEPLVEAGVAVRVPFGSRQEVGGFVVEYPVPPPAGIEAKAIRRVASGHLLPGAMRALLEWVADHYLASPYQVYTAALPRGLLKGDAHHRLQLHAMLSASPPAGDRPLTARQAAIVAHLETAGGLAAVADLTRELRTTRQALDTLARRGAIRLEMRAIRRMPPRTDALVPPPALSAEQAAAVAAVREGKHGDVFLLHGVTGSGKTEVYLQAIADTLARGLTAIALVPEIALTPQQIARFAARFGDRIAVLHSGLSDGERFDEWSRARSGDAQVVIGARSAIFAPVENLGLIVVDEEHDGAYKQEQAPRYHARAVALRRAQLEGARVILGSATPSLEAWYAAQRGTFRLLELPRRVAGLALPPVQLVDMRQEAMSGPRSLFGRALTAALRDTLSAGDQAIVLLNRRGHSPFVLCQTCGATAECPQCSVSLTYHRAGELLRCHYCGFARPDVSRCDRCGAHATRYLGAGTQKVVEALAALLPAARVLRLDRDATSRKDAHFEILESFAAGEADILVGTQMVAKGLDFPRVSLVGVLAADAALRLPDFRSAERTFQLVTQVAGRAGRQRPGRVVVQAFAPDHPALALAAGHDYKGFAAAELSGREGTLYPPFGRLLILTISAKAPERAEEAAREIRQSIAHLPADILGPAPAPIALLHGQHRMLVVVKTRRLPEVLAGLRAEVARLAAKRRHVRISVDVDAQSML